MKVNIRQIEGLAFAGRGESRHWVVMDTLAKFGGLEGASKPMELVLMSLAGCTGMDVVSILKKMRVDIDDFEIGVEAEQAEEHPKVFRTIHLEYRIFGDDIDPEKVEKAIALSQEKYCSVSAMLQKTVAISHAYRINPPRDG